MAGWQFGNQEEPSKPTKGERIEALEQAVKIQSRAIGEVERIEALEQAVKIQSRAIGEVERNLGRYDIAAMASAGKTLEQANADAQRTLSEHSNRLDSVYAVIDKRDQAIRAEVVAAFAEIVQRLDCHAALIADVRTGLDEDFTAPLGAVVQGAIDDLNRNSKHINMIGERLDSLERQQWAHGLGLECVHQRAMRIEAEQRDIVACQDSQGDRLRALEGREAWCNLMHEGQSQSVNPAYASSLSDLHQRIAALEKRIGMGEASDEPAEPEPFDATGIPLYADPGVKPVDRAVHRFEFDGTRGQVSLLSSLARVVATGDWPADDRGISAIYGGDTETQAAFIHVAGPDTEPMRRAWRNMLAYLSGDDLDRD